MHVAALGSPASSGLERAAAASVGNARPGHELRGAQAAAQGAKMISVNNEHPTGQPAEPGGPTCEICAGIEPGIGAP